MMNKNKLPNIIPILILTLVTVTSWIAIELYTALSKHPQITVSENISRSFSATLDQDSINKIESRLFMTDSQIPDMTIGTPTPAPTSTPASTPTATILPKEATTSGTTQ